MELYNKKFVRFEWDDELEGKTAFVADNIVDLAHNVRRNDKGCMTKISKNSYDGNYITNYPFKGNDDVPWRFCYYDPLYMYKAAYNAGKKVEWRYKRNDNNWNAVKDDWDWIDDDAILYRISEEGSKQARLTNRRLAHWLTQGYGEVKYAQCGAVIASYFSYYENDENKEVGGNVKVRKWTDTEWHEPTYDYCFGEEGKE